MLQEQQRSRDAGRAPCPGSQGLKGVPWLPGLRLVVAVMGLVAFTVRAQVDPSLFSGLEWRLIGPFRGGRAVATAGVPGQPNTYYFGAVAGGVWKTTDGGVTWKPIFDAQPIASIGAIAVAPSNPNIIYAGTGEADMRSDISFGDGVYKSMDGGQTWQHVGLEDSRAIGRILVDPRDPNLVLVAVLGHAYGPNTERGVFRSTDGGATWKKVLYRDPDTGAIDLCLDPSKLHVVYASLWQTRRPPWSVYGPLDGPGGGVYKSTDGGATWMEIKGHGLPAGSLGRIGIAVAQANPQRVYAVIDAKEGGVYRSDDAGANWQRVGTDPRIWGRGWYFGGIAVDPNDPDKVYVCNTSVYLSNDGGKTWTAFKGAPGGDDYHQLWIDPSDGARMIVASDQGAVISVDGGETWSSWYNQPTAQLYHVVTDNEFPYWVYGAQQDSGAIAVASRSDEGQITFRDWFAPAGGESSYIAPDPTDPNVTYGGTVSRLDRRTRQARIIGPEIGAGFSAFGGGNHKYRFDWTAALVFSATSPHVLYLGSQYLLETNDAGNSWRDISPDLTGADPSSPHCNPQGSLTAANAKCRGHGAIYTVAPSPREDGLIWVGTDTGLIHLTRDHGKTWTNVTPPGLADWDMISLIAASPSDPAIAYAAVDAHQLDDFRPHIYRTHDYGQHWTEITRGIAALAYVHAVREDSERKGLLFAGTETGIYVSFDYGDHWQSLQLNLPVCPIHDLVVHDNDLVVATHGRSFWILDGIAPLRQAGPEVAASDAYLFRPSNAWRIQHESFSGTPLPPETPAAKNPPDGAAIDYYLKSPAAEVALEILDGEGKVVRRYSSTDKPQRPPAMSLPFPSFWMPTPASLAASAGMHRFVWDLRYGDSRQGPWALPGAYQVRLTVAGRTYNQPLEVKIDPRVTTSREDLVAQFDMGMKIYQALQQQRDAASQIGSLCSELKALRGHLASGAHAAALVTMVDDLDHQAEALQKQLPSAQGGAGQFFGGGGGALGMLANAVNAAAAAPTEVDRATFQKARQELSTRLAAWSDLQNKDLSALNAKLHEAKLAPLDVAPRAAGSGHDF